MICVELIIESLQLLLKGLFFVFIAILFFAFIKFIVDMERIIL